MPVACLEQIPAQTKASHQHAQPLQLEARTSWATGSGGCARSLEPRETCSLRSIPRGSVDLPHDRLRRTEDAPPQSLAASAPRGSRQIELMSSALLLGLTLWRCTHPHSTKCASGTGQEKVKDGVRQLRVPGTSRYGRGQCGRDGESRQSTHLVAS